MSAASPTLTQAVRQIRQAWFQSSLPEFVAWWGGELRACLPRRTRDGGDDIAWYLVTRTHDGWLIRANGSDQPLAHLDGASDPAAQASAWQQAATGADQRELRLVLCLPPQQVLRRTLHLPLAARANLCEVVGYDIDRQTPWRAADTFHDVRVLGKDRAGRLRVELAVTPRAPLQAQLDQLDEIGLALDAVDVADVHTRTGLNLLPPAARAHRSRPYRRARLILATLAIVLGLACMGQYLHNRHAAFDTLQAQVDNLHQQARSVAALRRQVQTRLGAADFLAKQRATSPRLIDVLADVTRRLPDDTWLERFSITGNGQVSMQGLSPHATGLLKDLAGSAHVHDPGFRGVIQTDPASGKERFYLSATLTPPQAAADPQASKEAAHAQTRTP